jgi:hypothetical protein
MNNPQVWDLGVLRSGGGILARVLRAISANAGCEVTRWFPRNACLEGVSRAHHFAFLTIPSQPSRPMDRAMESIGESPGRSEADQPIL